MEPETIPRPDAIRPDPQAPTYEKLIDCLKQLREARVVREADPDDPYNSRIASWIIGGWLVFLISVGGYIASPLLGLVVAVFGVAGVAAAAEAIRKRTLKHWTRTSSAALERANEAQAFLDSLGDPNHLSLVLDPRLGTLDDPQSVPAELFPVIQRLAPQVDAECYRRLSPDNLTKLCRLLAIINSLSHADLVIEILRLVWRMEDTGALERVYDLAASAVASAEGLRVKNTAKALLPRLREAARRQQEGDKLLRASIEPEDTLLRPAAGIGGDAPDYLLRPTKAE